MALHDENVVWHSHPVTVQQRERYINSALVRICWMAIMFATDYAAISVLAMPIVKRISVASVKWRI